MEGKVSLGHHQTNTLPIGHFSGYAFSPTHPNVMFATIMKVEDTAKPRA